MSLWFILRTSCVSLAVHRRGDDPGGDEDDGLVGEEGAVADVHVEPGVLRADPGPEVAPAEGAAHALALCCRVGLGAGGVVEGWALGFRISRDQLWLPLRLSGDFENEKVTGL